MKGILIGIPYEPDPGAFNGLELEPVASRLNMLNAYSQGTTTPLRGYLLCSDTLASVQCNYQLRPCLRTSSRRVVYYQAFSVRNSRLEYIVGPGQIYEFDRNVQQYIIAAGNFFGITGRRSAYETTSAAAVALFFRGQFGRAWGMLGAAWLDALQDPLWYMQVAVGAAGGLLGRGRPASVASPARGARPSGVRRSPSSGGGIRSRGRRPPARDTVPDDVARSDTLPGGSRSSTIVDDAARSDTLPGGRVPAGVTPAGSGGGSARPTLPAGGRRVPLSAGHAREISSYMSRGGHTRVPTGRFVEVYDNAIYRDCWRSAGGSGNPPRGGFYIEASDGTAQWLILNGSAM